MDKFINVCRIIEEYEGKPGNNDCTHCKTYLQQMINNEQERDEAVNVILLSCFYIN